MYSTLSMAEHLINCLTNGDGGGLCLALSFLVREKAGEFVYFPIRRSSLLSVLCSKFPGFVSLGTGKASAFSSTNSKTGEGSWSILPECVQGRQTQSHVARLLGKGWGILSQNRGPSRLRICPPPLSQRMKSYLEVVSPFLFRIYLIEIHMSRKVHGHTSSVYQCS